MAPFAALADPTRKRIIEMLAGGPLCAGDIAGEFALSAPAVSQHLKVLREAKLVRVRPQAQRRIYELDRDGVEELSDWIGNIRGFWSRKLGALEEALIADRVTRKGGGL
jgi:DNA-binding transcriptional ArsR family regulator